MLSQSVRNRTAQCAVFGIGLLFLTSLPLPASAQEGDAATSENEPQAEEPRRERRGGRDRQITWNNPREFDVPGLTHQTLDSSAIGQTVGFNIYLPPQYENEPDRRFRVVYFLHGAGGNESSDAGFSHIAHRKIVNGEIEPMIWVFPNGGMSGYRDRGDAKVETMIIEELIPHIDENYRTLAKAESRGVAGFSMGGGGAMRYVLKYPDLFGTGASFAASLGRGRNPEPDRSPDGVYAFADALTAEQAERLWLMLVIGEDDFLFSGHAPFVKHMHDKKVRTTYIVHSYLDHNFGMLTQLSGPTVVDHLARQLKSE